MDPHFWAWLLVVTIVFLLLAWALDKTFSRLDRLPRPREPRNAPRTRQQLYRPGAGEERER